MYRDISSLSSLGHRCFTRTQGLAQFERFFRTIRLSLCIRRISPTHQALELQTEQRRLRITRRRLQFVIAHCVTDLQWVRPDGLLSDPVVAQDAAAIYDAERCENITSLWPLAAQFEERLLSGRVVVGVRLV